MSSSKILFYLCLSFIIGIGLASFTGIASNFIEDFFIAGFFFVVISIFIKDNHFTIAGFCLMLFFAGIACFHFKEIKIIEDPIRKLNDKNEKVSLLGGVADGPDVRDKSQKLKVKIDGTESIVLATVDRKRTYDYLDRVSITGELKAPTATDEFDYQTYLMKDGIYSVMDFPKIELTSKVNHYTIITFLYSKTLLLKDKLQESINGNFKPPVKFLLEGILLGNNKNIPKDLRDKLSGTNLRYLTAISGVHVLLLSDMLVSLLLLFGLWRQQAIGFSLILIWLYVILTGFSASGIRAATMGSIFLSAQILGKQNTSSRTIALAAAIMLFNNPLLFRYDIGFQLSFLASAGIIYLKPLISSYFEKIINKHLKFLRLPYWKKSKLGLLIQNRGKYLIDIASVTLTAQLFTVPLMLYAFGNISLIAPIANLLVLPIMYWLMLFGFLSAFLGIFSGFLGWIFYWPAWLLASYFLKIMDIFYQPWTIKSFPFTYWMLIIYYTALGLLVWIFYKSQRPLFTK